MKSLGMRLLQPKLHHQKPRNPESTTCILKELRKRQGFQPSQNIIPTSEVQLAGTNRFGGFKPHLFQVEKWEFFAFDLYEYPSLFETVALPTNLSMLTLFGCQSLPKNVVDEMLKSLMFDDPASTAIILALFPESHVPDPGSAPKVLSQIQKPGILLIRCAPEVEGGWRSCLGRRSFLGSLGVGLNIYILGESMKF